MTAQNFLGKSFFGLTEEALPTRMGPSLLSVGGPDVETDRVVVSGGKAEYRLLGHTIATWDPVRRDAVFGIEPKYGNPYFYEDGLYGKPSPYEPRVNEYFNRLQKIVFLYFQETGWGLGPDVRMAAPPPFENFTYRGLVVAASKRALEHPACPHPSWTRRYSFPVSVGIPLPLVFSGGVLVADWLGIFYKGLTAPGSSPLWESGAFRDVPEIYSLTVRDLGGIVDTEDLLPILLEVQLERSTLWR